MAAFCTNMMENEQVVVEKLQELFGDQLDLNKIRAAARASNFDINQSTNDLLDIANTWPYQEAQPKRDSAKMSGSSPKHSPNKKPKKAVEVERVQKEINDGFKVLIILRGVPGSGKSWLAKKILENTIGYDDVSHARHILSTDDFFMENGCYQFNGTRLREAHEWNQKRADELASKGYSPLVIDNTNTVMAEMKPYALMAAAYGYILEVLEPNTPWFFNETKLTNQNIHGVPQPSINRMLNKYQKNVTPPKLLAAYAIKYSTQIPQYRLHPPLQQNHTNQNISQVVPEFNIKIPPPKKQGDFQGQANEKSQQSSSVDDLFNADTSSIQAPVLKPDTTKISKSSYSSLYDTINLQTWGIDEQALQSWDICTPLNFNEPGPTPMIENDDIDNVVETSDMSIGTEDCDFLIIKNLLVTDPPEPYKVLEAYDRDINEGVLPRQPSICKKITIDTSTMTEDTIDYVADINRLTSMFPDVSQKIIKYWYRKCDYDITLTSEVFIGTKSNIINSSVTYDEVEKEADNFTGDSDSSSTSSEPTGPSKESKNKRKNYNSSSSEESQGLKKYIESKVNINDDHYSEKLRKIRQTRYGHKGVTETPQSSSSLQTSSTPPIREMELADFEFVEGTSSSSENEETVELNLGDYFVKQLEDKCGDPNLQYPKGFQPVIQMPVSLARQLYTFYIESVYQQMDAQNVVMEAMQKEDEEFARKLQEEEESAQIDEVRPQEINDKSKSEPTEIPEIMREQRELSKWQKEADKWKDDTPDTLAARLTQIKLFNSFPWLDRNTLVEILHAHDDVYKDTVETLLLSTNSQDVVFNGDVEAVKQPPINREMMDEMWTAHNNCRKEEEENEAASAQNYRDEASRYLEKRKILYEKAQRYYQQGLREVAQFYSALAAKQTRFYEIANGYAVTGFLDQHSKRLEDFNTLDLHFLYVKEAIPTLDMFLDRNINLLRLSSTKQIEFLQIITGRGKNSKNGIPKIRPAVMRHLSKRDISYQGLNPGLLKIKITKQSKVTSEL